MSTFHRLQKRNPFVVSELKNVTDPNINETPNGTTSKALWKPKYKRIHFHRFVLLFLATSSLVVWVMMFLFTDLRPFLQGSGSTRTSHTHLRNLSPDLGSEQRIQVTPCSKNQLDQIQEKLRPSSKDCFQTQWKNACPVTIATRCPDNQSWIEKYYRETQGLLPNTQPMAYSFVALNIGCNKGTDAVKIMRMGSLDPIFDIQTWRSTFHKAVDGVGMTPEVCTEFGSDPDSQYHIPSKTLDSSNLKRKEMHCIEPMPSTALMLQRVSEELALHEKGFIVHPIALSNQNGHVYFPSPGLVKVGVENVGIQNCMQIQNESERMKKCTTVPTMTLDTFSTQYISVNTTINYILIDVEGYDIDVLLSGSNTLQRTEYIEFEYNWKGSWGSKKHSIASAVHFLDRLGFTCYWAGVQKLWRITSCVLNEYEEAKFWSNVACVNRILSSKLSAIMENEFLRTIHSSE